MSETLRIYATLSIASSLATALVVKPLLWGLIKNSNSSLRATSELSTNAKEYIANNTDYDAYPWDWGLEEVYSFTSELTPLLFWTGVLAAFAYANRKRA